MSPALPQGQDAPTDGLLPASTVMSPDGAFGLYLHVPFCRVRCGYCDFNTYTSAELGGGADQDRYAATTMTEIDLAGRVLGRLHPSGRPTPVSTVFFGGGTPTLLPAQDLVSMLDRARAVFGLRAGAEVTVEANPDSVTPESLQQLASGGVTRVSFGMQSAVSHVLAVLERTHDPAGVPRAVDWARAAGLSVSLDLIYGTPGESRQDWVRSVEAAIACHPDHVSAYALVVEEGTRLAVQVRRGQVPAPQDDDLAAKYLDADDLLTATGLGWYEVSNWARTEADQCRHNLGYWSGAPWWGIGPGAHSHVRGVRWWNVKHPRAYADRLTSGLSPAAGREVLTTEQQQVEAVMLGVRLRSGLDVAAVPSLGPGVLATLKDDGLIEEASDRLRLTRRGRLLADGVTRSLLGWDPLS